MLKAVCRPASRAVFAFTVLSAASPLRARAPTPCRKSSSPRSRRRADRPDRRLGDRHPRRRGREAWNERRRRRLRGAPASTSTKPAASARRRRLSARSNPGETLVLIDGVRSATPRRPTARSISAISRRSTSIASKSCAGRSRRLRLRRDGRRDQHHHPQGRQDDAAQRDGRGGQLRHAVDPRDAVGRRRSLDVSARRRPAAPRRLSALRLPHRPAAVELSPPIRPCRPCRPTIRPTRAALPVASPTSSAKTRRSTPASRCSATRCASTIPTLLPASDVFSPYNHSQALIGDGFVRANFDALGGTLPIR